MTEEFKKIFEGLDSAYGQYIKGDRGSNGKQGGKAFIQRKPITDQLWQDHLDGKEPALGIIPINKDNKCKWGCIDIDVYNLNHKELINQINQLKLPLITFRSKSGGAHVFLFTKKFISAALMQTKLKEIATGLGYEDSEIFPKQTEILVERGDTGNFLNLPYHNVNKSLRYAYDDNANALDLKQFFDLYNQRACNEDQVISIQIDKPKIQEAFEQGPPCLNKLAMEGFGEGGRNNALFNIGVFYKKVDPDKWKDLLEEANVKYMDPPLKSDEVQGVIKSLMKKGYDKYKCKDEPIRSKCKPALCRLKKFGVGYDEEQMPVLQNLTKIDSKPPQWFLDVDGKRIELNTEQLYSQVEFAKACLDQSNLIIPTMKAQDWRQVFLKPLMPPTVIAPLESLDKNTQLTSLILEFTTNRAMARRKEDILNRMAWTDDDNQFTYFRLDDFFNFAKRNNWEKNKNETGNLIKQSSFFEAEPRMRIGIHSIHVIKIKAMKKQEPSMPEVKYQENHF